MANEVLLAVAGEHPGQFPSHPAEHLIPVAPAALAEEAHGGIPGSVLAVEQTSASRRRRGS